MVESACKVTEKAGTASTVIAEDRPGEWGSRAVHAREPAKQASWRRPVGLTLSLTRKEALWGHRRELLETWLVD